MANWGLLAGAAQGISNTMNLWMNDQMEQRKEERLQKIRDAEYNRTRKDQLADIKSERDFQRERDNEQRDFQSERDETERDYNTSLEAVRMAQGLHEMDARNEADRGGIATDFYELYLEAKNNGDEEGMEYYGKMMKSQVDRYLGSPSRYSEPGFRASQISSIADSLIRSGDMEFGEAYQEAELLWDRLTGESLDYGQQYSQQDDGQAGRAADYLLNTFGTDYENWTQDKIDGFISSYGGYTSRWDKLPWAEELLNKLMSQPQSN